MSAHNLLMVAWLVSLLLFALVGFHIGKTDSYHHAYDDRTLGELVCLEHLGGHFVGVGGSYERPLIKCESRSIEIDWECATTSIVDDNGMVPPKIGDDCNVEVVAFE